MTRQTIEQMVEAGALRVKCPNCGRKARAIGIVSEEGERDLVVAACRRGRCATGLALPGSVERVPLTFMADPDTGLPVE